MPKFLKIFLFLIFPLFLLGGGAYGLAKIGVIPVRKLAVKNPAARAFLKIVGLDHPKLPAVQVPARIVPVADPLESQKKELAFKRSQLEKERTDWEAAKETQKKAAEQKSAVPESDPKAVSRLAAIYEQMPPESVNKIFAKLPDPQVVALLRRMDEKKAAGVMALVAPDRAAKITTALARPAPNPGVNSGGLTTPLASAAAGH